MRGFRAASLCILGRQPWLGLAELESLYGSSHVRSLGAAAILDVPAFDIAFNHLGGTIKAAQVLAYIPTTNWNDLVQYLSEKIPEHMQHQPSGKFTLGLSLYGLPVSLNDQNKGLMAVKRSIRAGGKSVRIVPNKTAQLNSAQVLHNKLTTRGAWELLLVRDGSRTILAQTIFVQDIDAYAARDQARPARDAKVGMLPPKLAQIMINLANPPEGSIVLDPFCGTGVILQESLLMGYGTVGSDDNARMVEFSKKNLDWLAARRKLASPDYKIVQADATIHKWQQEFNVVASEVYLGRPLAKLPPSEELYKIAGGVNILLKKFLANLGGQIKSGIRLCLAVPAWRVGDGYVNLPTLDNLSDLGYNQLDFNTVERKDLVYFRKGQIVARRLIVLEKK